MYLSIQPTDLYETPDDDLVALKAKLHAEGRWHEERLVFLEQDYRRLKAEERKREAEHQAEIRVLRGEPPRRRAADAETVS